MDWALNILLSIFIILIVAVLTGDEDFFQSWRMVCRWILESIKIKKSEIASWYKVSRPTFRKWVKSFNTKLILKEYFRRRAVSLLDFLYLLNDLGNPEDQKPLTKGEILDIAGTYYHTIRQNIKKNIEKLGITYDQYKNNSKFPPKQSAMIVEMLG